MGDICNIGAPPMLAPSGQAVERALAQLRRVEIALMAHLPLAVDIAVMEIFHALFTSWIEQRPVFVKDLQAIHACPSTTLLRRLDTLEHQGFITRTIDIADHRRSLVQLTAKGAIAMLSITELLAPGEMVGEDHAAAASSLPHDMIGDVQIVGHPAPGVRQSRLPSRDRGAKRPHETAIAARG